MTQNILCKLKIAFFYLLSAFCFTPYLCLGQEDVVDEEVYNKSNYLLDKGWEHLSGQDYDGALVNFNASINLYTGNADAYVGRANSLLKLERYQEAERDILTALEMTGDQADMHYLAGNIYFKMKFYNKATASYAQALRLNPESEVKIDSTHCYYNRGNAYFESGLYRSAINDYSKVIAHDQSYMNAYHNRGLAYKHREMLTEACEDFLMAKDLGSKLSQKYIDKYCNEQ